ncbi:MAG TPA: VanZ family protein [Candidatus Binatia bacterium]|nr:VanZ family protein [Candidatus Binatia bacterium]
MVPFDFHPRPLAEVWRQFQAIRTAPVGVHSRADWAANVLLFVPLAYLWCAALWPRHRWAQGAVAVTVWAAAVVLSATIEFTQSFLPSRSVSLNDIVAEGCGAALGVVAHALTGPRLVAWLRAWGTASTVPALARPALGLYLAGLLFFGLLPLDLSLSPAALYGKFAAGRVVLWPLPPLRGPLGPALTDVLTDVAVWVPAGLLWRLSGPSGVLPWLGCVAAALGIEAFQLLVWSRVVDLSDVTLAAVGSAAGVWLAGRACRSRAEAGVPEAGGPGLAGTGNAVPVGPAAGLTGSAGGRGAWRPALAGAVGFVLWLGVVVAVLWQPFDFTADCAWLYERARHLSLVPFRAYYFSSELRTVTEFFRKTLLFLPLGAAAALGYALVRAVATRLSRADPGPGVAA